MNPSTTRHRHAFTLVEMLLVVAVIALLISILLPTLSRTKELSRRAVCASHMHGIHQATINYASANLGKVFVVRGRSVQKAFNAKGGNTHNNRESDNDIDWVEAMSTVGLSYGPKVNVGGSYMHYRPADLWDCPSRNYKSQWEVGFPQLVVGYQYFGGIETWINPFVGSTKGRSPLTMKSRGDWTLVADAAMKIDGVWGGGRASAYGGLPAHADRYPGPPAGGNQAYFDGAVEWVPFNKLIFIHSWSGNFSRTAYFYQRDLGGWNPPLGAYGQP